MGLGTRPASTWGHHPTDGGRRPWIEVYAHHLINHSMKTLNQSTMEPGCDLLPERRLEALAATALGLAR